MTQKDNRISIINFICTYLIVMQHSIYTGWLDSISVFIRYIGSSKVDFSIKGVGEALINARYTSLWYIRNLFVIQVITFPFLWLKKKQKLWLIMILLLVGISVIIVLPYYGIIKRIPVFCFGGHCAVFFNDFTWQVFF